MQLQIEKLGKVSITVEEDYWDINKDYDKLTIVEKEGTFGTFISRKPVPAGTVLTDRKYWIPFSSLKEEIILNFNKWVSDYGALLGSQAETLNHIQELINSIYVHLPNGVVFKGDVDSVRPGFEREIILEGKTINEENAQFILYKNNEEIYRNEDSNNFSISDIVNGDTEYKLVTIQNGYKYISTWNVAIALPLYAGGGQTYQDAVGDNKIVKVSNDISGIYSIVIDKDEDYIFFVAPKGYLIKSIKMNGLDVPIKSTKEVYLGTDYIIYQSDYQYKAGTYPIQINDYTGLNGEDFLGILNSLGDTASAVDVANLKERIDNLPVNELIDKEYAPAKFSGMGRVYLRKNIKNGKNILEQDMMLKSNTIYIIQYEFELETDITIPDNCIVDFNGGTIRSNGNAIYLPENITIQGRGFINIDDNIKDFAHLFRCNNAKNIVIKDITIDMNGQNNIYPIDIIFNNSNRRTVFSFSTGKNVLIKNITVLNCNSVWIIEGNAVDNIKILNNNFLNCGCEQLKRYDTSLIYCLGNNITVSENNIFRTGKGSTTAIEIEGSYATITNNHIKDFNTGILKASNSKEETSSHNIISNNVIENAQYGIDIWATHKDIDNLQINNNNITISDNIFDEKLNQCIGINFYYPSKYSFKNIIISNNIIIFKHTESVGNQYSNGIDIQVYGNGDGSYGKTDEEKNSDKKLEVSNITITNNIIKNSFGQGICADPRAIFSNITIACNLIENPCTAINAIHYALLIGTNILKAKAIKIYNNIYDTISSPNIERVFQINSRENSDLINELNIKDNTILVKNNTIRPIVLHSSISGLLIHAIVNFFNENTGVVANGSEIIVNNVIKVYNNNSWT